MGARTTDPETSKAAATDSASRQSIRVRLLQAYADAVAERGDGLTDEEAMVAAGFDPRDGHWRRCSELRRAGLITQVVQDGQEVTRTSERTGKTQMVCTITEAGIDILNQGIL